MGAAAQGADAPIPGDTVVCADDAICYPPVAGDDAAALAASTFTALAPAVSDAIGMSGAASAVIAGVTAGVGTLIAGLTEGARAVPVVYYLENEDARGAKRNSITRFTLRNTVRSSAATFRDYDPCGPSVRLQSMGVSTAPFPPSPLEAAAMAVAAAENTAAAVVPAEMVEAFDQPSGADPKFRQDKIYSEYDYQFLGAWIDNLLGKRPGALAGWLAHLKTPDPKTGSQRPPPPWSPPAPTSSTP